MLKALIWKEYRQNLRLIIGASAILLIPYVTYLGFGFIERQRSSPGAPNWHEAISYACAAGLLLTLLIGTLFGASAVASERGERSSQFIAYLPIPKGQRLASKVIVSIGICFLFWLINAVVASGNAWLASDQPYLYLEPTFYQRRDETLMFITAAVFLYGTAWLFGNFVSNVAIALGASLAALITVGMAYEYLIEPVLNRRAGGLSFAVIMGGAGLACFIAGAWIYMKRLEP